MVKAHNAHSPRPTSDETSRSTLNAEYTRKTVVLQESNAYQKNAWKLSTARVLILGFVRYVDSAWRIHFGLFSSYRQARG
jgi:hypothetical protein